jgi:dienelactone hydrolase
MKSSIAELGPTFLFAALLGMTSASAQGSEEVRFRSAGWPPTEFRMQLAKERGETVVVAPGDEIGGTLYRPPGSGPFPAVVFQHGSGGRFRPEEQRKAEWFLVEGYVVLYVDSYGPRNMTDGSSSATISTVSVDMLGDVLGALDYLARQDFVRADRVAIVGFSLGANAALRAVARERPASRIKQRFAAAVAYSPSCRREGANVDAPSLVLIGELDTVTPAIHCREMMERKREDAPIRIVVYPLATHGFTVKSFAEPQNYYGHRLVYNSTADEAARQEMMKLLRETIGR